MDYNNNSDSYLLYKKNGGELIDNNDQMGRRVKYAFKLQTS